MIGVSVFEGFARVCHGCLRGRCFKPVGVREFQRRLSFLIPSKATFHRGWDISYLYEMAYPLSCFPSFYPTQEQRLICSGNCEDNWWLGMQEICALLLLRPLQTTSNSEDPTQSVIADIFAILPGSQVITSRMWFLLVSPTFLFINFSFQSDG